jgi:hypothetical protein
MKSRYAFGLPLALSMVLAAFSDATPVATETPEPTAIPEPTETVGPEPRDNVDIASNGGKVMIGDAQVIIPDIGAANGVIRVIDAVLLPPASRAMWPFWANDACFLVKTSGLDFYIQPA